MISRKMKKGTDPLPSDHVEGRPPAAGIGVQPVKKSSTEASKGIVKGELSLEELEELHGTESN